MNLFLQQKNYKSALILAMQLKQPLKMLHIFKTVNDSSPSDQAQVNDWIAHLEKNDLKQLLSYLRDWNTHSKYAMITQQILYTILRSYSKDILFTLNDFGDLLDSLIAYTQRHFDHANEMLKQTQVIGFTLECMELLE